MKNSAVLLVECPDSKGIVAGIADFIFRHNGNILHADEHQAPELGLFLCRVEWELDGFDFDVADFARHFGPIAEKFHMRWRVALSTHRPRVAIFVSKYDHCLVDLLYRQHSGELACDIPLIVSNHPDAKRHADFYGIPFREIAFAPSQKEAAEQQQIEALQAANIELVVLARYMQILSPDFVARHRNRIINVHHSFLPAFVGARPYHQAFRRGVKLIGSTSHYVTEALDDGPIIEQDVTRISHRDELEDLVEKGRDLERVVLSRAVKWHLEHRILHYGSKTIVFN